MDLCFCSPSTIVPPHWNTTSHKQNLLIKSTFNSTQFHKSLSTNHVFRCRSRAISIPSRPNKAFSIRASTQVGAAGSGDSLVQKFSLFRDACWRFLRPHTIRGTALGSFALVSRALIDDTHLITWSLLLKALWGVVALICGNGYIVGINQIYDVEIDKVNKPFLPIAAGDLSIQSAWALVMFFAVAGISVVGFNFGPFITSLYCLGLFLGSIYSVPPFRMKQYPVAAFLIIATDPKRVLLTETKLRKGAMHLWRNLQLSRERSGQPHIVTWEEMKHELEQRYIPASYRPDLSERIANYTQGYLYVAEYSDEFHTLSSRAEDSELEYITVGRYKRGFRKQIRDIMRMQPINTMSEAFQTILNAKNLLLNGGASTIRFLTSPSFQGTSVSSTSAVSTTTATVATTSATPMRTSKPASSFPGQCITC